ncbi:hypothetical protein NLX86_31630 [Streptomyces sp. A3M-1-3]|uniref:WXG100 family type VII secretion target n=1 Tax=Streptomyces sp. A3M-1-3 TaxID=2962044 RepID=UPI0020B7BD2C|nr:hypothetical protein [Streptomyces sp. A3M-1-3]MCP3822474.1 hypothetical protein [Streptomyces sp. A3M-1-3]
MSHETMLAWLDAANASAVQDAADRLAKAAKEIHKIAEDLKVRPQWVEWKGEGADAFRTWGADLHSSTVRLGDYSEGASKWLSTASDAIALAKSTIPRTLPEEAANLAAASKYRNDPDSGPIGRKAVSTLPHDYENATPEAKAAAADAAQLAAADRMRVLADSYADSQQNMDKLERPVFPPPPGVVMPAGYGEGRYDTEVVYRTGDGSSYAAEGAYGEPSQGRTATPETVSRSSSESELGTHTARPVERPVDMEIDSVATLPDVHTTPPASTGTVPPVSKPDGSGTVVPGAIPPAFGGKSGVPTASAPGRAVPGMRGGVSPGQASLTPRMPRESGIVGGRPVAPSTGRPTGGIPRGTVIGSEGTTARGPMGRGGMPGIHGGGPVGRAGQSGISGGRRLASEAGGVVGGRPGQAGQNSARPFTPGGSGLVRGANSNGGTYPGQVGRAGAIPPGTQGANSRRDERSGERPDYLSEDEETWQQGSRRVVPPVID